MDYLSFVLSDGKFVAETLYEILSIQCMHVQMIDRCSCSQAVVAHSALANSYRRSGDSLNMLRISSITSSPMTCGSSSSGNTISRLWLRHRGKQLM